MLHKYTADLKFQKKKFLSIALTSSALTDYLGFLNKVNLFFGIMCVFMAINDTFRVLMYKCSHILINIPRILRKCSLSWLILLKKQMLCSLSFLLLD